jgi:hypothetical protein
MGCLRSAIDERVSRPIPETYVETQLVLTG